MEPVLMTVTAIAIVLALTSSVLVFRVMRDERQRSAARVAALEAELARPEPSVPGGSIIDRTSVPEPSRRVTVPVASHAAVAPAPEASVLSLTDLQLQEHPDRAPAVMSDQMFTTVREGSSGPPTLALAVLIVFVTVAVLGGVMWNRDDAGTAAAQATTAVNPEPALELISLRHAHTADAWTISGLARNPTAAEIRDVTAIAFLFDKDGSFLASGRASLELPALAPGDESPFVIAVPTSDRVARYRVSFRSTDGTILRHIDRRQ